MRNINYDQTQQLWSNIKNIDATSTENQQNIKVKIQEHRYESDKNRSAGRRAKRAGPQKDFRAPARESRRSSEVFLRLIVASKY